MTPQDLADIQTLLNSWLPESYIEFILSDEPKRRDVFYDRAKIIEANLSVRKEFRKGEPLDRFFYVFGRDENGRMLFMDLDFSGGAVMREDDTSTDPSHRARFLSVSFSEWLNKSVSY